MFMVIKVLNTKKIFKEKILQQKISYLSNFRKENEKTNDSYIRVYAYA